MSRLTTSKAKKPDGPHFAPRPTRPGPPATAGAAVDEALQLIRDCRRIVLLTEGHSDPKFAKTAIQLLRYRPDDVVAVLDSQHAGATAERIFGIGGATPVVDSLSGVDGDSLFLGIAPSGGLLPGGWRRVISEALVRGMHVVSGLHTPLAHDQEFTSLLVDGGPRVVDIRRSRFDKVAEAPVFRPGCVRVHTVGVDCSVGKMSAAKEIELGLHRRGRDAAFVATGQTGVMISGRGVAIDSVVSDFVNGAAEQLVLENQHHDLLLIEGQGSLVHPAYSGVTMGLLHGSAPDALILCYEAGRQRLKSLQHVPIWPLDRLRDFYEEVAGARHACEVIGVALNGHKISAADAADEQARVEAELGLPACDVYRDGPERLVDAVESFDQKVRGQRGLVPTEKATP